MKLSTKIKKYTPDVDLGEYSLVPIVLMVDCKRDDLWTYSFAVADEYHRHLTQDEHCTLLPLNECPVYNGYEVIMHYTSTTYKEWCNP
ncbi:MAG: hypothetical protein J6S14_02175 [Clostridia bacterium]|nr:hypothetical protein [Clostridia bacterium]